jgi:broad specificity phosphatase PhoE
MKKTIFYFMRHGEVYNPENILYGRLPNFRLSNNGKKQVERAVGFFQNIKIDILYSSPLLRAKETAKIIGSLLGLPVYQSSLLNEVKLIFQGTTLCEYKKNIQPHLYTKKYLDQGQESIPDIFKRMMRFVQVVTKKYKGKTILAVSHGDPIGILKAKATNHQFTWKYKNANYLKTGNWLKFVYNGRDLFWQKENLGLQ